MLESRAKNTVVDCHVIEGRSQGSKTVLICLLRALADLGFSDRFILSCRDAGYCLEQIGRHFETTGRSAVGGSVNRLLIDLPMQVRRVGATGVISQYIIPLTNRKRFVMIHDILPVTHPILFDFRMRLKAAVLFLGSAILSTRVIVVSDYTSNAIAKKLPWIKDKISIVRNGPSFQRDDYFVPKPILGESISEPYILSVGRIERRKNIDLLIRAHQRSGLKNKLVIVGRREGVINLPVFTPGVEFKEGVEDDELLSLYRNAALFVFPSQAEGFGIPLLDALLFGIPTISSNLTSMPEVGGSIPAYFDPSSEGAEETLSQLMRGHFQDNVVQAPTLSERIDLWSKFNWIQSAKQLLRVLEIL